jgi:hypothetical protein
MSGRNVSGSSPKHIMSGCTVSGKTVSVRAPVVLGRSVSIRMLQCVRMHGVWILSVKNQCASGHIVCQDTVCVRTKRVS